MPSLAVGDVLAKHTLTSLETSTVEIPDGKHLVHLQFRRFAGCPFCNLHLHSVKQRYEEIIAAGVRVVAVFHSSAAALRKYQPEMPFAIIPDPSRNLYQEFGVETRILGVALPRMWVRALRAGLLRRRLTIPMEGETPFGLPAEFLIAPQGRVVAVKYGEHVYDQWTVDEVLQLATERSGEPHQALASAKP